MIESQAKPARVLAIGDIHGCLAALDSLIEAVQPTEMDLIVTLGDYIGRGPDSKGVLDRLIDLHSRFQVVSLRGNHEQMMLGARYGGHSDRMYWMKFGGIETIASYRQSERPPVIEDIPFSHWEFIEKRCRMSFETTTHIFVHANLESDKPIGRQSETSLCWEFISPTNSKPHVSGKPFVCGHAEQRNGIPLYLGHAVCIDTFAHGGGWLTCLDVASGKYWQSNQQGQTREGSLRTP